MAHVYQVKCTSCGKTNHLLKIKTKFEDYGKKIKLQMECRGCKLIFETIESVCMIYQTSNLSWITKGSAEVIS